MRWDRRKRKQIEERRFVPGEIKTNEGEVLLCAILTTKQDSNCLKQVVKLLRGVRELRSRKANSLGQTI